jgi:ABC-2 type transport system permease protein
MTTSGSRGVAPRMERITGFAGELQGLYALWLREVKVFQREKSRVISAMATPFLWILLVGSGFGATTEFKSAEYARFTYQEFMYPGIIAMTVLFGTVFYGLYIVWDRKLDVLKEVLVAPVSRITIFFGKVLGGSTESLIQGIILLTVGVIFFNVTFLGALQALPIVLLLAVSFVSVGLFIGSFFESLEGFQVVVSFLVFPLFFLSGALYPLEGLPLWLTALTRINPAAYAVDALRGSLLGVHQFPYLVDVAVLVAFSTVFIVAGALSFKRMK